MDFARLWEQARELWARPIGKLVFGSVALFIIILGAASVLLTRPQYVALGTFGGEDAAKVKEKLDEKDIPWRYGATGFSFLVPQDRETDARLVLAAETNLDPQASIWSPDLWSQRQSWSNTDFDKRALRIEQIEGNLSRSIRALSVVEAARVTITVPMKEALFKQDEVPPKAVVMVQPRKGQKLSTETVEAIMMMVSGGVERLVPENVYVADASTNRMVSGDAFQQKDPVAVAAQQQTDAMSIQDKVQDRYREQLVRELEKVVGSGRVAVFVNLSLNWEKVESESVAYSGANNGKGIVLSEQQKSSSSEGAGASATTPPVGTTTNSEPSSPTYPGTGAAGGQTTSSESSDRIINYLVNQIKTNSVKPGGAVEEVSVGLLINSTTLDQAATDRIKNVVTVAMGTKAQVSVEAVPFADDLLKVITGERAPVAPPGAPSWLFWVLGVALGLAAIGFFFVATRPKRPVLEPVFAGSEAAMMGGIPVTEMELPPPIAVAQEVAEPGSQPVRVPTSAEEAAKMPTEEVAKLTDDLLKELGLDPQKVRMLDSLEKIAKNQPEQVASLLRTWISQE